jgi:sulfoxide reductase heme-binding subunit YedZ
MTNQNEERRQESLQHQLNVLVHFAGILPLILLLGTYTRGELGFNPIEMVIQRTGRTAAAFLLLSLSCTPINSLFKLPVVGRLRKPLGLYAALYAALHFAAFSIWDYGLNFNLIWMEIREKPFIIIGASALIILIVLAATSFRFWQRKLGKWWTWLHRLAYVAGVLLVVHYLLATKGDLFSLQGDYAAPLIAGGVLIILLILRLPFVARSLRKFFGQE